MPRTANNYDTFTAIAEPKRRQLIEVLIDNEKSVSEIVLRTQWSQPMVSKHLSVLKESGIVSERKVGRQRFYRVNANQLKPVEIWVRQFEKYWIDQFNQLDTYLTEIQNKGSKHD